MKIVYFDFVYFQFCLLPIRLRLLPILSTPDSTSFTSNFVYSRFDFVYFQFCLLPIRLRLLPILSTPDSTSFTPNFVYSRFVFFHFVIFHKVSKYNSEIYYLCFTTARANKFYFLREYLCRSCTSLQYSLTTTSTVNVEDLILEYDKCH